MYTGRCLSPERSGIIGKSRDYNDYCCLCIIHVERNIFILTGRWLYTGPRDETRDFLALQVMRSMAGLCVCGGGGGGGCVFNQLRLFHGFIFYLSLVTRKPIFGVFDQVRLKPAC